MIFKAPGGGANKRLRLYYLLNKKKAMEKESYVRRTPKTVNIPGRTILSETGKMDDRLTGRLLACICGVIGCISYFDWFLPGEEHNFWLLLGIFLLLLPEKEKAPRLLTQCRFKKSRGE